MSPRTRVPTGHQVMSAPDGRAIRVLVVDDEPTLAELVGMALRYEGWEIQAVHDGGSAISAARSFKPDLIVLDVMLSDMDGFEVLRRFRSESEPVPVLFLTARDAVEDRIRAHRRRRRLRH